MSHHERYKQHQLLDREEPERTSSKIPPGPTWLKINGSEALAPVQVRFLKNHRESVLRSPIETCHVRSPQHLHISCHLRNKNGMIPLLELYNRPPNSEQELEEQMCWEIAAAARLIRLSWWGIFQYKLELLKCQGLRWSGIWQVCPGKLPQTIFK